MKITKRGSKYPAVWHGVCQRCKSEAEAAPEELDIQEGGYRNGYEPFAWAECPVCGAGGSGWGGICFHPKKGAKI